MTQKLIEKHRTRWQFCSHSVILFVGESWRILKRTYTYSSQYSIRLISTKLGCPKRVWNQPFIKLKKLFDRDQNRESLERPFHLLSRFFIYTFFIELRGCSYGGELARLRGLARLGEMIFIPRSHGIFYLSSIKKFVMSLEKDCLIKYFLQ